METRNITVHLSLDRAEGLRGDIPLCGCREGEMGLFVLGSKQSSNIKDLHVKDWYDCKVSTVSVQNIECLLCEHASKTEDKPPKRFKLKPESDTVKVTLKVFGHNVPITGANVTQFVVNSNIATTRYKLQGMTKNKLIVLDWDN